MKSIDSLIPLLEVEVMPLRDAGIIPHPFGDFPKALPGNRQQGSEGVAHDMRSHPGQILPKQPADMADKFVIRSNEVVAVAAFPANNLGSDAEIPLHRVVLKELQEHVGQGNGAGFPVLGAERISLGYSQRSGLSPEPRRASFDDLITPQAGLKPTMENESDLAGLSFGEDFHRDRFPSSQQRVAQGGLAIGFLGAVVPAPHADPLNGIHGNRLPFFLEPGEEAPQAHHVALDGRLFHALALLLIEALDVFLANLCDQRIFPDPLGKPLQGQFFILGGESGVLVAVLLELHEGINFCQPRSGNCQLGSIGDLQGLSDCLVLIAGFQCDRSANPLPHSGEIPEPVSVFPESAHQSCHESRLAIRLANCQTRMGLHGSLQRGSGAGEGIRTLDINLGKVALYQLSYARID